MIEVSSYNSGNTCGSTAAQTVASVTYNGIAAIAVPNSIACATKSGSSGVSQTQLFYLLNSSLPVAGGHTVVVTFNASTASAVAGAISLTGVAQGGPEAVATTASTSNVSSISTSITTKTNGAWLVDVDGIGSASSTYSVGSGQTARWYVKSNSNAGGGSTKPMTTAGATTMSWTSSGDKPMAQSVASFAP